MNEENVAVEEEVLQTQEAPAEEPQVVTSVFCRNCGTQIPQESSFCPNCGTRKGDMPAAEPKKKKKLLPILIGAGAAIVVAIVIILCVALRKIPVEKLEVSEESVAIMEQENCNVSCVVYPDNATDKTVIWTSSDEKIAKVDQYGRITAVAKGECTITAKSGEQEAEIEVTVKRKLPDLKAIYDEFCDSIWADIGDDGSYLSIDSNPYDYDDGDYRYIFDANDAIEEINKTLGLPDSLYEDMNQTTWSMGKQEEIFESVGIRVTWTYHPDKGLEVSYKLITE